MIILLIMTFLSFCYAITYKSKRSLHMLQQNLYNENNRYIKWIIKNIKQFISLDLLLLGISLIGVYIIFDLQLISNLCLIIIVLFLILIGYSWNKKIKNDQNKKKLVITARIKRLIFTTTVLYMIPVIFAFKDIYNTRYMWTIVFFESLMLYLNSLVIFIALIINMPVEKGVYLHYKRKAQKKLQSMPDLKIIGITGSYGKTSCKNILSDILNIKYNALASPKNLNTYNGLIMTVNNYMDKFTDIFIAEMGAYVKGEIAGLCRLVKPKYGIITRIGTAHLESFGSEENIIQGKFELVESLPSDGFAILNGDDPKQVNYQLKNKVRTIWIGIENKEVDVRALNIKCSNKGTNFDVIFKGDDKKYHFDTKLLGDHNVYNILSALACSKEFGVDISDLIIAVKNVRPIEHRLELKRLGNFYQIDDAYNSNPIGASNACKILGMMPGYKVVVTPGMIELGSKEDEYNKKFGEQIAKVADIVILIGKKKTQPIKEGLLTSGFNKEQIVVFNDVREAYPYINNIAISMKEEVYALFENDLPDTYNEN